MLHSPVLSMAFFGPSIQQKVYNCEANSVYVVYIKLTEGVVSVFTGAC